jgi:hypothetical protein
MRANRKALLILATAALCALTMCPTRAHADAVSISLATAISGPGGDTITVYGNLTNNTSSALFFSNDSFTINSTAFTASDDIILNAAFFGGPSSIAANGTLSNVDLFTIQIVNGSPQIYVNNFFGLIGGSDATACSMGTTGCDTQLGTLNFSVDVTAPVATPEPGTLLQLALGLGALALGFRRWRGRDPVADA